MFRRAWKNVSMSHALPKSPCLSRSTGFCIGGQKAICFPPKEAAIVFKRHSELVAKVSGKK